MRKPMTRQEIQHLLQTAANYWNQDNIELNETLYGSASLVDDTVLHLIQIALHAIKVIVDQHGK